MSDIMTIKLIAAATRGDLEDLEFCIGMGSADINAKNEGGLNALIAAATNQRLQIVKRLLKVEDIDVNSKGPFDKTALSLAVQKGYAEIVRVLLTHPDIDVNTVDKFSQSALMKSLRDTQIFGMLVTHKKIDVNYQKKDGVTALMQATNLGLSRVVKEFLRRTDIDISLKNKKDETAEDIAQKKKSKEIILAFQDFKKRKLTRTNSMRNRAVSSNKNFRAYTSTLTRGSSFLSNIELNDDSEDEPDGPKDKMEAMKAVVALKSKSIRETKQASFSSFSSSMDKVVLKGGRKSKAPKVKQASFSETNDDSAKTSSMTFEQAIKEI